MSQTRRELTKALAYAPALPLTLSAAAPQDAAIKSANPAAGNDYKEKNCVMEINFKWKSDCGNNRAGIYGETIGFADQDGNPHAEKNRGSKRHRVEPFIQISNKVVDGNGNKLPVLYIQAWNIQSSYLFEPEIGHPGTATYIGIPWTENDKDAVFISVKKKLGIGGKDNVAAGAIRIGSLPGGLNPCAHFDEHGMAHEHTGIIIEC